MIRKRTITLIVVASIILVASCDSRQRMSTLVIQAIHDTSAPPLNPTVHIALSEKPSFTEGYKSFATSYDIASGGSPAVVFSGISWEEQDKSRKSREFWLLIAYDTDGMAGINEGDHILPAMRVVLSDGEETIIPIIYFDTTSLPAPDPDFLFSLNYSRPWKTVRIFIDDPSRVTPATRLFVRFGNLIDLTAGFDHQIAIGARELATGLVVNTDMPYVWAYIDANGDGSLTAGANELISSLTSNPLNDYTNLILYADLVY